MGRYLWIFVGAVGLWTGCARSATAPAREPDSDPDEGAQSIREQDRDNVTREGAALPDDAFGGFGMEPALGGTGGGFLGPSGGTGGGFGATGGTGGAVGRASICGTVSFTGARLGGAPRNLHVLVERSASMAELWQGEPRHVRVREALRDALAPSASQLPQVTVTTFPARGDACAEDATACPDPAPDGGMPALDGGQGSAVDAGALDRCSPTSLVTSVSTYAQSGRSLVADLSADADNASIPLVAAGYGRGQAFAAADELPVAVESGVAILITADSPTCPDDPVWLVDALLTLRGKGYFVYHVLIPADGSEPDAGLLDLPENGNDLRVRIRPGTPDELAARLNDVFTDPSVRFEEPCRFDLVPPVRRPELLRLFVRYRNGRREERTGDGWSVSTGGSQLTLDSLLCDTLTAGALTELEVAYGCDDVLPAGFPID